METKLILPETVGNEITIREGQALPAKEPVKIQLSGDISTASNYLKVRIEQNEIDLKKAVIVTDKLNRKITLFLDPANAYGGEITGTLDLSDEIKPFSINQSKTFNREELVKLFRFNKIWFSDADKYDTLLKQLMAFQANVNMHTADAKDQRGNRSNAFNKTVNTDLPTDFILTIPIFKGKDAVTFRVELCYDVTEGSVKFWLESVEVHEIIQTEVDSIFAEELTAAKGFVIVNK